MTLKKSLRFLRFLTLKSKNHENKTFFSEMFLESLIQLLPYRSAQLLIFLMLSKGIKKCLQVFAKSDWSQSSFRGFK